MGKEKFEIAVLPGDGIGAEIVGAAVAVMAAVQEKLGQISPQASCDAAR